MKAERINLMKKANVAYLDQLIEDFKHNGEKPSKIVIGYKIYSELMNDTTFSNEVLHSALDASKRKYKKLKIKISQDEFQLKIE